VGEAVLTKPPEVSPHKKGPRFTLLLPWCDTRQGGFFLDNSACIEGWRAQPPASKSRKAGIVAGVAPDLTSKALGASEQLLPREQLCIVTIRAEASPTNCFFRAHPTSVIHLFCMEHWALWFKFNKNGLLQSLIPSASRVSAHSSL
jgi:hypothetical protein